MIFPILKRAFGEVPSETARPLFYMFFVNNFDFVKRGLPDSSVLGILWSVAVEEQFYLIWPILITLIPKTRIRFLFLLIIISTFCFRLYHYRDPVILEVHTFSCISDMAVGGYCAYLAFFKTSFLKKLANLDRKWWVILYTMITVIFLFRKVIFEGNLFLIAADRFVISLLFGLVILEQNYATRSFYKMSNNRLISRWGVYTYGLYCLHMIGILIVAKGLAVFGMNKNVFQVIFLEGGLSLLLTLLLAYISYNGYEKKFLKLKEKFSLIVTTKIPTNTNLGLIEVIRKSFRRIAKMN
jgi:peptidoglycan/LPS O-acetylase OafA/YrhL